MNNLIRLRGTLNEKKNFSTPGFSTFSSNNYVDANKIKKIMDDIQECKIQWCGNNIIPGVLINVHYCRPIPKSKRIKMLLSKGSEPSNNSIKGAKFEHDTDNKIIGHVITHYIDTEILDNALVKLNSVLNITNKYFNGIINNQSLKKIDRYVKYIEKEGLSKSMFRNMITDLENVSKLSVTSNVNNITSDMIINLYDIEDISLAFKNLNIANCDYDKLDNTTIKFKKIKSFNILINEAPYLISMSTTDISKIDVISNAENSIKIDNLTIHDPKNEPTIGVIDTLFDKNAYFEKWVEYYDMVDPSIPKSSIDYEHGTSVTSIIVDGAKLNPQFDDECGNFRVRHFGVAVDGENSAITIMRKIEQIVCENPDIHVWNLSLGSEMEINSNFISPTAALLDKIQCEQNVIFIVAGTNDNNYTRTKKIGSPADSINSLVVNSLDFINNIPTYARKGKVLEFFKKPDITYYGGDVNGAFITCVGRESKKMFGTSYAAPWISRKMSYLIDIVGLTRETAKALIIDSATDWCENNSCKRDFVGFGNVPIKISDVINSPDDEIKFYIEGISNLYDTYTHNIPVPINKEKFPYIAKATLCYFPKCSRNQGVDYTNTELDIYFGRITDKGIIKSINENVQSIDGEVGITEEEARNNYRKWDNVKHINQILKNGIRPKQKYDNPMWGLSIKSKERLNQKNKEGIKFGIVITLKEIYGINRKDEFINQCSLRGWLVNQINIENTIDVYNLAQEDIDFIE